MFYDKPLSGSPHVLLKGQMLISTMLQHALTPNYGCTCALTYYASLACRISINFTAAFEQALNEAPQRGHLASSNLRHIIIMYYTNVFLFLYIIRTHMHTNKHTYFYIHSYVRTNTHFATPAAGTISRPPFFSWIASHHYIIFHS